METSVRRTVDDTDEPSRSCLRTRILSSRVSLFMRVFIACGSDNSCPVGCSTRNKSVFSEWGNSCAGCAQGGEGGYRGSVQGQGIQEPLGSVKRSSVVPTLIGGVDVPPVNGPANSPIAPAWHGIDDRPENSLPVGADAAAKLDAFIVAAQLEIPQFAGDLSLLLVGHVENMGVFRAGFAGLSGLAWNGAQAIEGTSDGLRFNVGVHGRPPGCVRQVD